MQANQCGIIRIRRKFAFGGILAQFGIFIDNQRIGSLLNSQNKNFFIPVGRHTIFIQNDTLFGLKKSKVIEFAILEGETIDFECGVENSPNVLYLITDNQVPLATNLKTASELLPSPLIFDTLQETKFQAEMQAYSEEEFPIDNRSGSENLIIEHEVSKTASNQITLDTRQLNNLEVSGGLSFIRAKISEDVSKQIGQVVGETITRRQSFRFSVKSGSFVIYRITWKRKVRVGEYLVIAGTISSPVSYRVEYDLMCEIRAEEIK